MAYKFKGSLSAVDASLKGGVIFDNEKLSDSKIMPKGKFTINEIDESTTDLASNTLVTNFGKQENIAGMFSFNTGDWKDTDSAPVKLMMRVVNDVNDSDWVTIFDSSKTTVTWSSIAAAGQTQFTVPNLDFKKAIIYVNGVLQYPGLSYQTFGGTVTFNSKLSTGDTIYVVVGEDTTNTDNEEFTATATEDQTVIVLPFTKKTNFVFINGILQYPDSYTVSGSTITLSDKLYLNDDILVLGNETDLVSFTALASQDQTDFTLPGEFDDGLVYINGVLQYDNAYSVSGTTLSFISSLDENDNVFVTLNDPKFIDSVNASYTSTITDESNNKLNIPYFNFSELQVFINGVLQNPDSGAYILNGTEITLSSPLQLGDDIHVIVYNSPVQNSNLVTKADLTSYATAEELQELKNSLKNEGINLKWQPHLPSIEVAFGLPRRSLKMWTVGSTSTVNQYWLYPVDGTVWTGTGTLGTVPSVPFYKLDSNKDVITWTYTATSDNVTRIFVPYNFGSINIFINGVLQSINLNHYTLDGQYVNLNGALQTGDNFIAILGKLVFNTNPYVTNQDLINYAKTSKLDFYVEKSNLSSEDGLKYIGMAKSVSSLRMIEPEYDGQHIEVKSFYENLNVGGGIFVYESDNTNTDDGLINIVTYSGKVWKRKLENNIIYISMAGILGNGDDETAKLVNLISVCSSLSGYVIDGENKTITKSSSIEIDLVKVGLQNISLYDTTVNSYDPYYILILDGSSVSSRKSKGNICVFNNVEVYGAVNRNTSNVHGILIQPSNSLSSVSMNNIDIRYVNCGLVFAANSYLTIHNNWVIHNCNIALSTTQYTGTSSTTLNNAGENIRFNDCIISDSNMISRLTGFECGLTFSSCSFDYTGGSVENNYVQWSDFRQGSKIDFYGCHFESGNVNDNWTGNYFQVNTSVAINIIGGMMRHSSTYNSCPYWFYDESTNGQFVIEGTDIWGAGVRQWSNRGMSKFYPMINGLNSQVRGYLSDRSDLILENNFSNSTSTTTLDNWQVIDGTKSGALTSDVLSCTVTTFTDSNSITYPALKVKKLKTSAGATLRLYVKAPYSNFGPLGTVSIGSNSVIIPSGVCTTSVGFVKSKNMFDSYGQPLHTKITPVVSTTITSISSTISTFDARGQLTISDDYKGYDYLFLSVNLGGLSANDEIYITYYNLEVPKR